MITRPANLNEAICSVGFNAGGGRVGADPTAQAGQGQAAALRRGQARRQGGARPGVQGNCHDHGSYIIVIISTPV